MVAVQFLSCLVTLFVCYQYTAALECGPNEVVDDCPADCATDSCPKSQEESRAQCPTPDPCPAPACKCRFNYRRADNGTCISTTECPPFACKFNEEYQPCPPLCPNGDCSQATPDGQCPKQFGRIGIVLECSPACRCIKGYWRKNDICVPYAECGKKDTALECGPNEVVDDCPADCATDSCPKSQEESRAQCPTPDPCPAPACKCRFNYRRADNGTCISTKECPPFACKFNEEYQPCPPLCPNGDCSQATPDGQCPKQFGRIGIVLECSPACRCIKGYWRKNDICVPYAECGKNYSASENPPSSGESVSQNSDSTTYSDNDSECLESSE